jgi:hypothetical protein
LSFEFGFEWVIVELVLGVGVELEVELEVGLEVVGVRVFVVVKVLEQVLLGDHLLILKNIKRFKKYKI